MVHLRECPARVLGCFGVIYLLANLDRNNLVSASLAVGHSDQPASLIRLRKLTETKLMQLMAGEHEHHGSSRGPWSRGQRVWKRCDL
jgi:hypothetical protein